MEQRRQKHLVRCPEIKVALLPSRCTQSPAPNAAASQVTPALVRDHSWCCCWESAEIKHFSASPRSEVSAEAVGVAIAAPPADGEANVELIRYLAEILELKRSHISLDKVPQTHLQKQLLV